MGLASVLVELPCGDVVVGVRVLVELVERQPESRRDLEVAN